MSKKNKKHQDEEAKAAQQEVQADEAMNNEKTGETPATDEKVEEVTPEQRIAQLEEQLEHEKKEYLFLMSDFENFRRRTIKEKAELIKNGTEGAMRDLLPVVDDLERALDAISKGGDLDSLKEGVDLIYNKFVKYLESR